MENNIENESLNYDINLKEEEKVNDLLKNITLKKPSNVFNIFLKEKLNEEFDSLDYNDDSEIDISDKLVSKNIPYYRELWQSLPEEEKNKYKIIYNKEYNNYLKEIEIVKKYLFNGIDGKNKLTAFNIYLNQQLIEGLEKGYDPLYIKKYCYQNWKRLDNKEKDYFIQKRNENEIILELVLKYKNINPLILYVYQTLNNCKSNNLIIPTMDQILKNWDNLSNIEKNKYDNFSKDLYLKKCNLLNIYYIFYGIKPKTPSGAIRIFLEIKTKLNEISSINEGLKLWQQLSVEEKDKYLKYSHNFYLSYKYQELIFNNKINRIYPKKPNVFQIYLNEKKGIKIPKGNNTIKFWRDKFNSLNIEEKEKYYDKYKKLLDEYNKKLQYFNKKIFDLPKPPKNSFTLYLAFVFDELNKNNEIFDPKIILDKAAKDWSKSLIDKKQFEEKYKVEQERYKNEINYFEKYGYYYKNIDYNILSDNKNKQKKKKISHSDYINNNRKKKHSKK